MTLIDEAAPDIGEGPNLDPLGFLRDPTVARAAVKSPGEYNDPIEDAQLFADSFLTGAVLNPELSIKHGTSFYQRPCGQVALNRDECRFDNNDTMPDGVQNGERTATGEWTSNEFKPFTFFDMLAENVVDPDIDLQLLTNAGAREGWSWALSRELQASPAANNTSLQSAATDLTPPSGDPAPGPVTPGVALSRIAKARQVTRRAGGTILMPEFAEPAFNQYLRERFGQTWARGNFRVVTAPGFTGIGPDDAVNGTTNPDETDEDHAYIYWVPGVVEYNVSAPIDVFGLFNNSARATLARLNTAEAITNYRAVLRFNSTCVQAINVCLTCGGHG